MVTLSMRNSRMLSDVMEVKWLWRHGQHFLKLKGITACL